MNHEEYEGHEEMRLRNEGGSFVFFVFFVSFVVQGVLV